MKIYFFLILITGIGFSQATGLSAYGVGEKTHNSDPASLALGNSSFFSGNSKHISIDSPSSLWRSALTRFSIHSGFNYLSTAKYPDQYQQNLTSFSILFPVGIKKVFGFGLQPIYRSNKLNITDEDFKFIGADESITGAPIAYKNTYAIDGGISELFLLYSQKLTHNISGGIKYSLLFGNQSSNDELYTYDVQFDTLSSGGLLINEFVDNEDTLYAIANYSGMTEINKYRKFSGSGISAEGRYADEKHEFVINLMLNGKINVETTNQLTMVNSYTTTNNTFENSATDFSSNFGLGYRYKILNNSGITVEIHNKSPFNIPENAVIFNIMPPREESIHFGGYYQIRNSKIGYWNNLNMRGGAYAKNLEFTDGVFKDVGGTIGFGLEYLGNTQSIDIAFRFGRKDSRLIIGEYEKYISFHIGITTGEKWFMKRRRK
ncbi:MAG: hypothetical protein QF380_04095 [Candidatus Marinimicrobia bacterium]|jgi:hypothetical protein|nr:hypothetical protein [Candidatus Neomarinimicrobiota bacterium]